MRRFLIGVWEFLVGDDWRIALGVVLALALTALVADVAGSAWWVMPIAVVALLGASIRRAARAALDSQRASRGSPSQAPVD